MRHTVAPTRRQAMLALLGTAAISLALPFVIRETARSEEAVIIPAPALDAAKAEGVQSIVLAGGCFWGVQAVYQHTEGVISAVSGYSGGSMMQAKYELVAHGKTTHAESVEVKYDPAKISLGKILHIFFSVVHDPTQLDRQGPDIGAHYRSAIFIAGDEQRKVAQAYIAQLDAAKAFPARIVTKLEPFTGFYPAEDYHQDYAFLNPNQPYIYFNDRPKVENLRRIFAEVWRDKPVLVKTAANAN